MRTGPLLLTQHVIVTIDCIHRERPVFLIFFFFLLCFVFFDFAFHGSIRFVNRRERNLLDRFKFSYLQKAFLWLLSNLAGL